MTRYSIFVGQGGGVVQNSRIDAVTLGAVMIAAGVALTVAAAPAGWLGSIAGITLLLILFSFDREGYRSASQSLAFGAVCGFCLMAALRPTLQMIALNGLLVFYASPLTWLVGTVVFWAIDRERVSARERGSDYGRVAPAPPVEASSATLPITPFESSVAAQEPLQVRAGKETSIYVNLVGEGLNVMRSVRAEQVARNYYRITEEIPEGETWQFGPGQVVRCEKRKLSTGKGLVAVEEAKRKES